MKLLQPNTWNERQQVVAIIAATVAIIAALWFLALLPQNVTRRSIERQIREKRAELERKRLLFSEDVLREMKRAEVETSRQLEAEWKRMTERLSVIEPLGEDGEGRVGHIDFKVALYEARFRMNRKARNLGIELPRNLGMEETVPSGEDARKLLFQLRALERLTDLALDLKVGGIRELEPLPPIRHAGPGGAVFLEEYPVRVRFEGDIRKVFEWFDSTLQSNRTFAVRGFRVDGSPKGAPTVLTVTAIMSALHFPRELSDVIGPPEEKVLYTTPLGH